MSRRSIRALLPILLLLGCTSSGAEPKEGGVAMASAPMMRQEAAPQGRLVVRSASIAVEVEDREAAAAKIEARVLALGGYVTHTSMHRESADVSVRVPSEQLDAFLDEVAALGEETRRTVSGRDITEAYADTEAEITNLTALRDRLRALLDRATKVEEIVQVERELTRVQTRLDSLTGYMKRMKTDLELSPVSITLEQRPPPRILGPLGLLYEGAKWVAVKLFVISP